MKPVLLLLHANRQVTTGETRTITITLTTVLIL